MYKHTFSLLLQARKKEAMDQISFNVIVPLDDFIAGSSQEVVLILLIT